MEYTREGPTLFTYVGKEVGEELARIMQRPSEEAKEHFLECPSLGYIYARIGEMPDYPACYCGCDNHHTPILIGLTSLEEVYVEGGRSNGHAPETLPLAEYSRPLDRNTEIRIKRVLEISEVIKVFPVPE